MKLTDRVSQVLVGTLVLGLTLAPATIAGAGQPEPGGNGDLTSEPPCLPDWEPCGPPDPCDDDDECPPPDPCEEEEGDECPPPDPCDDAGEGDECPDPESCDEGVECPDPDPDPDTDPQPVDPPVVARPNFTG